MSKSIFLGGAGGAPTNNVIWSLRESGDEQLIGANSSPTDLMLADVDERCLLPSASAPNHRSAMMQFVRERRPDLMHFQHDGEIKAVSSFRDEIEAAGTKLFMPRHEVIENCVDKHRSYAIWRAAGVRTPETLLVSTEADLKSAFAKFGETIWIRAIEGGGGKGALPASSFDFAKLWIDQFDGWGSFTAAELLSPDTVTWLSIWHEGELVVAQTRLRKSWNFGDRTLSGVTGVTGVGKTWSDDQVTSLALDAIRAIDDRPHGVFGVDMTYDMQGQPNVTEINISRFFTTVYFFTSAGLNLPRIYVDIGLYGKFPALERTINPLPDGLLWIRGMDRRPVLVAESEIDALIESAIG